MSPRTVWSGTGRLVKGMAAAPRLAGACGRRARSRRVRQDRLRRHAPPVRNQHARGLAGGRGLCAVSRARLKLGIVTSGVGWTGENGSGGIYAYRVSKAGADMVALNLHHELSKRGIAVLALHPGMVATDLTKDYPGDFNLHPAGRGRSRTDRAHG